MGSTAVRAVTSSLSPPLFPSSPPPPLPFLPPPSLPPPLPLPSSQLKAASDYEERSAIRKALRQLKKEQGRPVGRPTRREATYNRFAGRSSTSTSANKPVVPSGSYLGKETGREKSVRAGLLWLCCCHRSSHIILPNKLQPCSQALLCIATRSDP